MNIRDISPDQLQKLGMPSVAYLKPVMMNGAMGYAIHAADGTPMALAADRDLAIAAVLENEMHPTWVH
jgi:hypothetical protein|eukprot:gene10867-10951_t